MTDIIFESFINLFQSVVVTVFLIISLGCKDKYNKKCVSAAGILITFIYLTVSNHIVYFESVAIYVYMVYSLIFSFVVLGGSVIEKIFYNIMMICCLAGSSLLGGGLVSLVVKKDFLNAHRYGTGSRYVSVIFVQILLMLFLGFIIKLKVFLKEKDNQYMLIMSLIPAISVIVCCFMVYRSDKSYEMNVIYTFIAMAGIIIINVISVLLLIMEQKVYEQKTRQQVMLSAYQQKEKDIESILDMQKQNSKQRHDINNVLILISELIQDEKYSKALEVLDKYRTGYNNINVTEIVSNNIVLNYLLNRKINQCREAGIDMACYVLGNIAGVDDMDLYILLENLCDNAIEAAGQCKKPSIKLQIAEDNASMYIDIGNTTSGNVLNNNPHMNTTKKDKNMHGFGIMNIRDIIDKYNGTINYEQQGDNYLMCRCTLEKVCQ
ncbi:MAG: GHKL domain-containing protein [Lachnospira sp.]|nr:GHKL domain-containing protein [Lachnospira sp.]